jgi:8-oxo-dGTP diphosphatase
MPVGGVGFGSLDLEIMSCVYNYPRPGLTVDCVVFGFNQTELQSAELKLLLIQRDLPPFRGDWALPGGFVREGESLDATARRELQEETGLRHVFLEQLYTFGQPERDPRGWVVTVAYYALVNLERYTLEAATDARAAAWFGLQTLPTLAFDHHPIVQVALQRLRNKIRYEPIGFELLPSKFSLSQLQHLYEAILEQPLDKRNFRKKILKMALLQELDEWQQDVAHRAARLYQFEPTRYQVLKQQGFNFEL